MWVCGETVRLFIMTVSYLLARTVVHWCIHVSCEVISHVNASHPGQLPNFIFLFDLHFLHSSPILFWVTFFSWHIWHFFQLTLFSVDTAHYRQYLISIILWKWKLWKLRNDLHVTWWTPFLGLINAIKSYLLHKKSMGTSLRLSIFQCISDFGGKH